MKNPKVSILCCSYNNSQWLERCFDSLINQTEKDIEILIGDDGSTDPKAISIINSYVDKDKRIKLDRHENLGCGETLNRLLHKAKGKYIMEIDSDDSFRLDAVETLLKYTEYDTVDIVKGSFIGVANQETSDGIISKTYEGITWDDDLVNESFCPLELNKEQLRKYMQSTPAQWCGMYRKDFLLDNHIQWLSTPAALYQDTSFSFKARIKASRVRLINEPVYIYNMINPDSSTKKFPNIQALINEYASIEKFLKVNHIDIWEVFARVKFGSYMWMHLISEDMTSAMTEFLYDMTGDVINRKWYSDYELQLLDKVNK